MDTYLVLRAEEKFHWGIITVTGAESPEDACHQVAEVTGRFGQYAAVPISVVPMNLGSARLLPKSTGELGNGDAVEESETPNNVPQ